MTNTRYFSLFSLTLLAPFAVSGCGSSTPQPAQQSNVSPQPGPELRSAAEITPAIAEPEPPPPPPPLSRVILHVVSAEIAGKMPNGEDWDSPKAPVTFSIAAPIAGYVSQHPELEASAAFIGIPVTAPDLNDLARKSPAADPMAIVELPGHVFRSPMQPRQFRPAWDFALTFLYGERGDRKGVARGATAQIHIVDYDGPNAYDVIGTYVLPIEDLISKPIHELGKAGSVEKLVLRVQDLPIAVDAEAPAPATTRLAVPGATAWIDTGVSVIAGQLVIIEAADEVCSKGGSIEHCSGPEGQRKSSSYNVTGFDKSGHAGLVGAIGDTRFAVGRQLRFTAPANGHLLLGINDRDVRDNRGSFAVRIDVMDAD